MAESPWHVEFYTDARGRIPVDDWIRSLDTKQEARVRQTIRLLGEFGLTLGFPRSRHLTGKLWELRTSAGRSELRVLYFAATRRTLVLLHGFTKKTQKTPRAKSQLRSSVWLTIWHTAREKDGRGYAMSEMKKSHPRGVPAEQILQERLRDPEFARAFDELEPEFQVIRQVIALRNKRKMTQAQLAKRMGTGQPTVARLESTGHIGTLRSLHRVATALDAHLEVRLVPNEKARTSSRTRSHRSNGNGR